MMRKVWTFATSHPGWAIFLSAFLLRLILILCLNDKIPESTDKLHRYDPIALNIVKGNGFAITEIPTTMAGPFYPYLLAAIYFFFGYSVIAVRIMQALLDAGHCALFYFITLAYFNRKIAILTALTLIISPLFIFSMFIAGTETPFQFLNALFIFLLTLALMNRKFRSFFGSGIVLGLATLCRAVSLLLPIFLLPVFFVQQNSRKEKFLQYGIFFVGFILTIGPWIVRNYMVFHKFVPVQTLGGVHLYMASPGANTQKDKITDWGKVGRLNSAERDQFFYSQAWKRIKQHPGLFVKGSVIRLGRMWYRTDSGRFEKPLLIANAVLIFFAIIGMVMCRNRWKDHLLFYVIISYYIIVHMGLVGLVRYALPVIPLLTAFAMVPIAALIARVRPALQKIAV